MNTQRTPFLFRLFAVVAGVATASPVAAVTLEPTPITIDLPAPNYLRVDGRWYVYEKPLSQSANRVTLYPQRSQRSFFLHGYLSARNCHSPTPPSGPRFVLAHGESLAGAAAGEIPLKDGRVSWVYCPGAIVLLLESVPGDVVCDNAIAPGYAPGACEALNVIDGIRIFKQGFES